jgi:hypothetical protein
MQISPNTKAGEQNSGRDKAVFSLHVSAASKFAAKKKTSRDKRSKTDRFSQLVIFMN